MTLEHIEKHFEGVRAVDDITLDIKPGEFITFVGPSGSGKTTSLMMVAGFETPTAGEIYIDRRPVVDVPPYRRNIGMVFQNYALFPHLTVAENIAFPLKQRRVDNHKIVEAVGRSLEIIKLPGYGTRYPRQLSGGQQQRVALARAIIFNPRVLLMDEPLGALDKQLREELQLEIRKLHADLGITFIYVTHDQEEALVMSDRVAVINGGRLEQVGSPEDLYERPVNHFVASFIGESNFFLGTACGIAGKIVEVDIGVTSLRGVSQGRLDLGGKTVVATRPEKIRFAQEQDRCERQEPMNRLKVIVKEVIFVGEICRYLLETPSGQEIILKQQQRFGTPRYSAGDAVQLEWHVNDTLVFE